MLPDAFLERMKVQLGEEYPLYLAALERPRAVALRYNPLKGTPPRMDFQQEAVPWEPMGHYYDPQARPGLHPWHEAGVYYLQEASAMAPVALLEPQPGERVLDLCAAPGGKTTQIAGRMGGKGLLLANEYSPKRAKILSQNLERMGVGNALVTNETAENLARWLPGFFHRVLVDAPCSGEGMFRKEAAAVADWSQETVALCARRQASILDAAAQLLIPGGRLVYSTCTFAPEENEQAVEAFLQRHPDFVPEEVSAPWFAPGPNGSFRLWPHKLKGEGHFAAVLRKMGHGEEALPRQGEQKLPGQWLAFAKELGITLPPGKAVLFGQTLYWAPPQTPELRGKKVLRVGIELGQVKKDYFVPAHGLALWLSGCKNELSLPPQSGEMKKYLHGETLPGSQRGWVLIKAGPYPTGWAKGDGNQLKNHYPKGLRSKI